MSGGRGLIELLHPLGAVAQATVLGSACPSRLSPAETAWRAPWDLAVLAPSADEADSPGWIAGAVSELTTSLAADGLVYLLAPPAARRRISRALESAGLPVAERLLHVPDAARSELLLPLERRALRGAMQRLRGPRSPRSILLRLALEVPGALGVLARLHPAVGLVARRPGGRPLAGWLSAAAGTMVAPRIAAVQTRWRANRVGTIVHVLAEGTAGAAVVKVVLRAGEPSAAIQREARALSELGPAARAAGAAVPAGSLIDLTPGSPALRLEVVPGSPAGRLLGQHPSRYEGVLRRIGDWLERWSRATHRPQSLEEPMLESWILGPAKRLAPQLEDGEEYAAWLEARGRRLVGTSVPLVATHNDLTMANVLIPPNGPLGVVDWEAASAGGLPLRDFLYAAVDATAALDGYRDRPAAFDRCFGSSAGGPIPEIVTRLREAVGVSDDFATLAFHGCWLQHAEDERRKRAPGEPLPFLACLRHAVRRRWQP